MFYDFWIEPKRELLFIKCFKRLLFINKLYRRMVQEQLKQENLL